MTYHDRPQELPGWNTISGNALKLFFDADAQRVGNYVTLRYKNATFDCSYCVWIAARKALTRVGLLGRMKYDTGKTAASMFEVLHTLRHMDRTSEKVNA